MAIRIALFALAATLLVACPCPRPATACCPAGPVSGKPVVNADQTVILIWDAATKTQHFIRQASFKSDADDFGFLVPTPAQPELDESGNEAFPYLLKLTEPERKKVPRPSGVGCGCSAPAPQAGAPPRPAVRVLDEKMVAGFHAVVLEADAADALVNWLRGNGYAYSPEVRVWAKPYVENGWKITALKVAKDEGARRNKVVAASALRLSFKTDRPVFPYREPDPTRAARSLGAMDRVLRIYFLAEARYQGELTPGVSWTGRVAWAGRLSAGDCKKVLQLLKLPPTTGPAECWLTEFEDDWPYRPAPADVYFSHSADQSDVRRPPIIEYVSAPWPADMTVYSLAVVVVFPALLSRARRLGKRTGRPKLG
jgi:hypothetical protein